METITCELYMFGELSGEAQAIAIDCLLRKYCGILSYRDALEWIHMNRVRFYGNGMFFDALGLDPNEDTDG